MYQWKYFDVIFTLRVLICYTVISISFPYSRPKQFAARRTDMCIERKRKNFEFQLGYRLLNADLRGYPQ